MSNSIENKFPIWPQALLFLALLLALLRKITDADIWFHMVIGREGLKHWTIPQAEFYVFPLLGNPIEFHEFGFGVFYQLVYNLGGFAGMAIVNALLATIALLCLYCAVAHFRQKINAPALLVLGLTAFYLDFRLVYRPETVLFLCLAIEILCLERFATSSQIKWLWPIPLAAWILSQMHPSSLFILGVLGIYFSQFVWKNQPLGLSRWRLALIFLVVTGATLVLASINPFGFKQVYLPLTFVSMGLLNDIAEFLPIFQTEFKYDFIAISLSGALAIWFLPQRRFAYGLLYLVFGWLAYRYVRNLALFALVMYVPTARLAQHLSLTYVNKAWAKFAPLALPAALVIILVLPVTEGRWGVGATETDFPEKSVQIIKDYLPGGNVLNFYDLGGYLAWALGDTFKIAVDGHNMSHNESTQFHNAVFSADPAWQGMLERYQVNAIVAPAILPFSGNAIPLLTVLAYDGNWALAGAEHSAMLFIRRSALPDNFTELDKNIIWTNMIAEAQKNAAEHPDNPGSYQALSIAYRATGDRENARINEQKYRQPTR